MTVLTLALLAGSQPAAPRLAPVHQIGPQSRRQSPHTPCAPLVRTDALTLTWQKADRHKRSAPTSSSHTPWPNPHSACGTAAAPLPAISCLGAFRTPAAERVEGSSLPASENLVWGLSVSRKNSPCTESFCHVIRLHCGTAAPCSAALSGQSPEAACGAPKARGLTANAQTEPQYCCRDVQTSSGRYSIYFYFVGSPFIDMRRFAA